MNIGLEETPLLLVFFLADLFWIKWEQKSLIFFYEYWIRRKKIIILLLSVFFEKTSIFELFTIFSRIVPKI